MRDKNLRENLQLAIKESKRKEKNQSRLIIIATVWMMKAFWKAILISERVSKLLNLLMNENQ